MSDDLQRGNPLETAPIPTLLLRYSVPTALTLMVNFLYNIVDQIFIGRGVGISGMTATNIAFPLVILVGAVSLLLGDGCAAYVSLALGRRQQAEADAAVGQTVTLSGLDYEVAGVIKAERRLGETNEHIAYIPITSASANALAMQTVEMIAKTADKTTGSAILMENTLKTWQPGGSFYNYDKLALGAAMPIRWAMLFVGVALLLSLLARLNAAAWGRVCLYADRLKTRYARDMLAGMIASALLMLLGYAALAGAAFALAKFSIDPLYVFTEWVPEVLVELSSIAKRFWSLNDANAAAVRYVSRSCCVLETGRALLRWGLLALLLGAWMNGLPFFSRRVKMPEINRER